MLLALYASEVLAKYADKNKSRRTNAALLKKPAKPCQVSNNPKPSIKNNQTTHGPSPLSQFLTEARETISNHVLTHVEDNNSEQDSYRCGQCNHTFDNANKFIVGCEGGCDKWFHITCVDLSEEDFTDLECNPKAYWECNECHIPRVQ